MKCQYCGAELPSGRFCANCGKPVPTKPASFQTEQRIPTPQRQPIQPPPQPIQPLRQVPPQPQQVMTQKKKRNPGVIVAIVLGALLVAALAVFLVLKLLIPFGASKPAEKTTTPEDQTQPLTQYAVSKEWLADCSMEKADLTMDGCVEYYTQDFDNDGWPELVITALDDQGKNAQCLLYAYIDGEVQLRTSHDYEVSDADARIVKMQLANKKDYSGFAVCFTISAEERYQYLSILQLKDNQLTEETSVTDTECTTYLVNNGWDSLSSGTPIILFDETLMSSVTPEMLTALTQLYDPQNTPDEFGMLKMVDGTVYAIEQTGLYRFADGGEKQLLCKAPEGFHFSQGVRLYYNDSFYMLGIRELTEGTKEYHLFRVDINTGTAEPLFTVPDGVQLLKVDEAYIYAQTSYGDNTAFAEITVYDRQGTEIETLTVPWRWDTDGKLVVGMDRIGHCSVITAAGQYLMENLPVEDAKLIDGSVYYLTGSDTSVTLCRLTATGDSIAVGTVPGTGASFRRQAGEWLVAVYDDDGQRTYYDLELETIYSEAEVKAQIPEAVSIISIDFEYDNATGDIYLVTAYSPHGNSGPLYRLKNGQYELLRNEEEEIFYWMFYDNMVYYGYKDYSNDEPYMQAPTVAGCISVAELSQREPLG